MLSARERLLRRRRPRGHDRWSDSSGDDPAAGLVNLFDLWMVFAVAVLLTSIGASRAALERVESAAQAIEDRMRPSGRDLQGRGERLGMAYRLASGEVVYVPEGAAPTRGEALSSR